MMSESNWARLLSELYNREESIKIPLQEESHDLSMEDIRNENLEDFQQEELETSIDFLAENGMIEYHYDGKEHRNDSPDYQVLQITTKGFDVAHDRELQKSQQELSRDNKQINQGIMVLTVILALSALIQAVSSVFVLEGSERTLMMGATTLIFLFIFGFMVSLYRDLDF